MNELLAKLDSACPGLVPDGAEVELPYVWMGDFVSHLIQAHLNGRTFDVQAAFDVIEDEIASNGAFAELAIVGFLEDVQNANLHQQGSQPNDFIRYLGPASTKAWRALNSIWQGN